MNKREKLRRFILGYTMLFLTGSVIGWIYETLFYFLSTGQYVKRGQGFGPWLPIYGFGAVLLYLLSHRFKKSKITVFSIYTLGAGLVELIAGWWLFHFKNGLRLWDYNTERWNYGNVGGFVCLRSVLIFGLLGLFFDYILAPFILKKAFFMKIRILSAVIIPIAAFFIFDFLYGYIIKFFF